MPNFILFWLFNLSCDREKYFEAVRVSDKFSKIAREIVLSILQN